VLNRAVGLKLWNDELVPWQFVSTCAVQTRAACGRMVPRPVEPDSAWHGIDMAPIHAGPASVQHLHVAGMQHLECLHTANSFDAHISSGSLLPKNLALHVLLGLLNVPSTRTHFYDVWTYTSVQ
jgi:hypothetical protein